MFFLYREVIINLKVDVFYVNFIVVFFFVVLFSELEVNWNFFVFLLLVKMDIVVVVSLQSIVFLVEFVRMILNVFIFFGVLLLSINIEMIFWNFLILKVIFFDLVWQLLEEDFVVLFFVLQKILIILLLLLFRWIVKLVL